MLSLDGKANRLATMIRGNLGAAMQGLAVVPLFAGFDLDAADPARAGRIFSFDVTGGRYEETGYDAIGSGSLFAKSALKKRYRPGLAVDEAVRLAVEALYDAADDDTATGGPDLTRKIFPVVMTATAEGTRRLTDEESGAIAEVIVVSAARAETRAADRRRPRVSPQSSARAPEGDTPAVAMQFYASPEQIMRDRAELARKGIARGRSAVIMSYEGGVLFVAENLSTALHKVSEIYDRIGFAAVGRYNEFESLRAAGVRMADLHGYSYDRRDVTGRALANAYRADPRRDLHRAVQAVRGGDLRRGGRADPGDRRTLPADLRRLGPGRAGPDGHGRAVRGRRHRAARQAPARTSGWPRRCGVAVDALSSRRR